jgi:D-glycero-alpha-D-manno-heptose 1-phosphate guanylyltransferase
LEALILAGGFGTRLRTVVSDVPKPMAPVQGRPFLAILLQSLSDKGVRRAILSVGYMHEKILAHFGERFGDVSLAYEIESEPLGTGGAVARSMHHASEDHLLVLNGDTFLDLELAGLEQAWQRERRPIIVGRMVPDTSRFGRLQHDGSGSVTAFAEKGIAGPGLINAGAYVLPSEFFAHRHRQPPFSIETDVLTELATQGGLALFETQGQFIDIGVPEDYQRAQAMDWGLGKTRA